MVKLGENHNIKFIRLSINFITIKLFGFSVQYKPNQFIINKLD